MSEKTTSPFVPATTPAIERANRLLGLRAHPGWADLIQLSRELVQEQVDNCSRYPGWDAQQIVVLKVRQQCATEYHEILLTQRVNAAIQAGIEEQHAAQNIPQKSAAEALDHGDLVRQEILTRFAALDEDMRPAGSY